ncbi:iron uptake protein [Thalassolituus sp.]|uniref:iron uptake protein n=1 Tax=Thalassolituus sp. TaxID=2030822 RepID=UPI0026188892|nr:iron uptake protein [uncultured Thalassolituus sp.]TNC93199.1 MAG: iron uptake protein [Thalassolituus sp.]
MKHIISHPLSNVLAALLGGYLFTWGFISLAITGSVFSGVDFHTAEHGALLIAFPLYLLMFFWIAVSQRFWLSRAVSFIGGTLMTLSAWYLQATIVQAGV